MMRASSRTVAQFRRIYDWANLLDSRPSRALSSLSNNGSRLCDFSTISATVYVHRVCDIGSTSVSARPAAASNIQLRSISTFSSTAKDFEEQVNDGEVSGAVGAEESAYLSIEMALESVVKIFTVSSSPNYFLPWQNKPQRETMGSGFLISGKRIITSAHVVADHTFVLVRKHGCPVKYRADVLAIGHECDLAILEVKSEEFWKGVNFLELGDIPLLQEAVAVIGYPQGGDSISITKGVVSRVEPTQYTHGASQLMAIQIDAAINPGNSGGPAIMGDKVVGVAFQNLSVGPCINWAKGAGQLKSPNGSNELLSRELIFSDGR